MRQSIHLWNPYAKTPRSVAAILEILQYMAYLKNIAFFIIIIKLTAKSRSFNILCTMDVLSCPTNCEIHLCKTLNFDKVKYTESGITLLSFRVYTTNLMLDKLWALVYKINVRQPVAWLNENNYWMILLIRSSIFIQCSTLPSGNSQLWCVIDGSISGIHGIQDCTL